MATSVATWTDSVSVIAFGTLARNATTRATLDLRAKWGAYLSVMLGRGGTTALTNGVDVLCRRTLGNNTSLQLGAVPQVRSGATAAVSTTCTAAGTPNNAGVSSLTVASTTGFAAGDIIAICEASPSATASEFARVARVTSATVLLLDAPTKFAHNDTGHTVRNQGDAWTFWLDGGATWEIVVDYGDDSAGESVTLVASAQTLDAVTSA